MPDFHCEKQCPLSQPVGFLSCLGIEHIPFGISRSKLLDYKCKPLHTVLSLYKLFHSLTAGMESSQYADLKVQVQNVPELWHQSFVKFNWINLQCLQSIFEDKMNWLRRWCQSLGTKCPWTLTST